MRIVLLILLSLANLSAQNLRIYAIDVEGGKATLYVSPTGESMLIDTGYDGHNNRDANRILAAAKAAGVKQIDYLVITHYHGDHAGGVPQLASKIPIRAFFDHGDNFDAKTQSVFEAYSVIRNKNSRMRLKPGDRIPIKGLQVDVVASSSEAIAKPLPGGKGAGKSNPLCASYHALAPDPGENSRSVGLIITFGNLRIADLGDLYWNQEYELACPTNKLGTVDLYMTTHHGTKTSGHPQIVHALHPKVAIMNNGADKGGSVEAWTTIQSSPGLADMWQLHFSNEGGRKHNAPDQFIANPAEPCSGQWIEVSATPSGKFTVKNSRNGFQKSYQTTP